MPPSRIERIYTVTTFGLAPGHEPQRQPLVSFGVAGEGIVTWGECLIPMALAPLMERSAVGARLRESTTSLLADQSLSDFRPLLGLLNSANEPLLVEAGIQSGIQQALLNAVAATRGERPAAVLAREYGLSTGTGVALKLIPEVPDYAATAELFARVLASAAEGVGYRLTVAESGSIVGPEAADIQRFTRELKERVTGDDRTPELYLALNGALGQLTGDPRLAVGKIGGMLVGLERAAAPLNLVIEDPVRLDDATMQIAVLKQLEEFLRFRNSGVRLATSAFSSPEDVEFAASALSACTFTFKPLREGDIERTLRAAAAARQAAPAVYVSIPAGTPLTKTCFVADVAAAAGADALLLGVGEGNSDAIREVSAYLARLSV